MRRLRTEENMDHVKILPSVLSSVGQFFKDDHMYLNMGTGNNMGRTVGLELSKLCSLLTDWRLLDWPESNC